MTLVTERLILRPWCEADRAPFAALNADPRVMEFFPACLNRAESDAFADRIEAHFARHGFGLWAVELPGIVPFIGFIGLSIPRFEAHFTPCVEIGYRLAQAYWGKGYASEGAKRVLIHGFDQLQLTEIVSFTARANLRSQAVMERIGMRRDLSGDFDHPALPENHWLRPHVLYRITGPASPFAAIRPKSQRT
jgi:RimJ/RimL family protein N-acetyltransferase